jgi:FtsP/CotA-like multicopper oxidase with cupredoxin domain
MEIGQNVRRRLSATSDNNIESTSNDEAVNLLREENTNRKLKWKEGEKDASRDLSRWLRPLGLAFAFLMLAMIFWKASSALSVSSGQSRPFKFSGENGKEDVSQEQMLGIQLHPKDHVFRNPKTIKYNWTITSGFRSPDGVKKEVYLVNDLFPGPTIECRPGDTLVIQVINALPSEGVSIHWHGLEMRGSNAMDGAVGLTQCPIPSNKTFTYEFRIGDDEAGTFWWHAHSQVQRGDGMYGGLVVHTPATSQNEAVEYGYEQEILLLIGDWYHRRADEVLAWYTSARGFGNEVRVHFLSHTYPNCISNVGSLSLTHSSLMGQEDLTAPWRCQLGPSNVSIFRRTIY